MRLSEPIPGEDYIAGGIANIMDCLLCLNKQFKKYVEYYLNEDYIGHIISLFDCASRIFLKEELCCHLLFCSCGLPKRNF